ncbi:chromate transporter [Actimicrobium sp. GrIS 1.19]|uniref:chromate transporter n=1 Tax=Actimicrobium sp. GrIS 1.19 TaxID=3071708 RepID=UPI002E076583|nr:chromate transporter [Actimicrobium sp. GrIS 1.19]
MNHSPTLTDIGLYFLGMSLIAIGGANVVIPDMHRQMVELTGWMSTTEFVSLAALAQAAPGPNVLIVTLLGWKLGGLAGAMLATLAMCLPSGLLTYFFGGFWQRHDEARWRVIVSAGLAALTVGLILASGYVLTRSADHNWAAGAITALTVVLMLTTRTHPLLLLAIAAALGYVGVL